eukprot:33244-Eustigmatos_ZCMA.PRE.1
MSVTYAHATKQYYTRPWASSVIATPHTCSGMRVSVSTPCRSGVGRSCCAFRGTHHRRHAAQWRQRAVALHPVLLRQRAVVCSG